MPLRLLVRARNSPTYPAPGSWRKGDIVAARPEGWVWGNLEALPNFIRCDLAFTNTPDAGWVQDQIDSEGGRRQIGVKEAEVDSVAGAGGQKTYNSAGQFVSNLEQKKAASIFVGP